MLILCKNQLRNTEVVVHTFPIYNATNCSNYIIKKASFVFKCHSPVFYSMMYAEIDRILLDRYKEEFQWVVIKCVSCRLDQLDAIACVGSHILPLSQR